MDRFSREGGGASKEVGGRRFSEGMAGTCQKIPQGLSRQGKNGLTLIYIAPANAAAPWPHAGAVVSTAPAPKSPSRRAPIPKAGSGRMKIIGCPWLLRGMKSLSVLNSPSDKLSWDQVSGWRRLYRESAS